MNMELFCITPTALKSPNNSNPPDDPRQWASAGIRDSKMNYYLMPLAGIPSVQLRQASEITSELMLGLDDSFFGKCSHQRGQQMGRKNRGQRSSRFFILHQFHRLCIKLHEAVEC